MTQEREGHRFLANWRKMVGWWIKSIKMWRMKKREPRSVRKTERES